MISESNVKRILLKDLNFDALKIKKLDNFVKNLLIYNKKHNFISKNTENQIWDRHILDSAQLIKFIDDKNCSGSKSYLNLADEFIKQREQSIGSAA